MKYLLILSTIFLAESIIADSAETDIYQLVWSDEFEVDGKLKSQDWTFERGFIRNNELQWYQPENAFCENGKLIIEGRKENKPNLHFSQSSDDWRKKRARITYTSASVTTKGLHSWQYGRFEVKAKISTQDGLWPAIWFLGVDGEWPSSGEVDLMEYYGGNILANACWGTKERWKAEWDSQKKATTSFGDDDWDDDFHIWRMDWDSSKIQLFVDNLLLNEIDLSMTHNPTDRGPKNPFHQPHYLLLSLAIGGNAGGDPSTTPFPSRYEIEYVRVFQKK